MRHAKIHETSKPSKVVWMLISLIFSRCDVCGKSFVDDRSLMRHAKIHATNKPFPCLHCDKGYVDANSLRKHMRNHECEVSGGTPQMSAFQ
jgi:hypothetical protein